MRTHEIRIQASGEPLPIEDQLAWRLAAVASDPAPLEDAVVDAVVDRIIDNAAVALAALNRGPVVTARAQAMAHPRAGGATVFGLPPGQRVAAEWAAWANGTAVRELDFHDTFLAADYSHPGDNIPPLVAVAQQCDADGRALLRAVAAAYEVHIALVKGICLHRHRIDHVAHLSPATAAGIGCLLDLPQEVTYQAIQQALHLSCATRQSRKGTISSWKAFAPAHAGKIAIEAVDRAMRGESAPTPIYEGEDSVLAAMLDGPQAVYRVSLPETGEPKRAILESYTKAHSAEYQSQAWIDLAIRLRGRLPDTDGIEEVVIHTSHHTHKVIGTGSGDPEKFDPDATRETLDHSLMYIFAVALQDGVWHHDRSYDRERARRPDTVRLWRSVRTLEDPVWTRRYHAEDPREKAFGGRVEIRLADGRVLAEEIAMPDAHPLGASPFCRSDYLRKFAELTRDIVAPAEAARFLEAAEGLGGAERAGPDALTVAVAPENLVVNDAKGLF